MLGTVLSAPAGKTIKRIHTGTIRNSKQVQQDCRVQDQYIKINCISIINNLSMKLRKQFHF